ncbi:hypothetical protein IAU59_001494 [Kwoniella sp. CBS 9459]
MAAGQQPTFAQYLCEKYAAELEKAITHPFLRQCGEGSIQREPLREWLKQDYLFAYEGGIKYTAALLSKLSLSPSSSSIRSPIAAKAVPILGWSATNLLRETDWFLWVAKEHGLDVFDPVRREAEMERHGLLGEYNPVTRGYIDYLQTIGALGTIEEGLVVLWASEKIYNAAWTYAKTHRKAVSSSDTDNVTQQALVKFIDNWTTPEFIEFVGRCEDMVDSLDIQLGTERAELCEKAFRNTLWYEQRFWPSV